MKIVIFKDIVNTAVEREVRDFVSRPGIKIHFVTQSSQVPGVSNYGTILTIFYTEE